MNNVKPQRKNQDSAGGMGSLPPRNLFTHIVITYGTSFMQTHIALQLSRMFDKSAFFCKTKPIFEKVKWM